MPTPHIEAAFGQIAKTVLMPGDPLRAKVIAETYLTDPVQVNGVRGMLAFTGTWKGCPVTVMGSGMGMPSIGIYSYELFSQYGVERIIRIGSAGAYVPELAVNDVVLADRCYSESSFARVQSGDEETYQYPSPVLNALIEETAAEDGVKLSHTCVHSSDVFYREGDPLYWKDLVREFGVGCVAMESFALFHNAKVLGKQAACLLTISDSFVTSVSLSAEDRQNSFHTMMKLALNAAVR